MPMKNRKKIIITFLIIIFCLVFPRTSIADTDSIYKEPGIVRKESGQEGLDDIIRDAETFESEKGGTVGGTNSQAFEINQGQLQNFSSSLFSILLIAATGVSVIVGLVIGIRYMMGSVEAKAKYKELLLPYIIGCIAVYGALGIWQLLVTILGSV